MKKFLLMLLLAVFSYTAYPQSTTMQPWTIENQGQWGSFYWQVVRNDYPDQYGRYYYYVYFYSNSLFNTDRNNDGQLDKAVTYIKAPTLYMYEKDKDGNVLNTVTFPVSFVVCDYHYDMNVYTAYFYSSSPYNSFGLTYQSVSPYDYSQY